MFDNVGQKAKGILKGIFILTCIVEIIAAIIALSVTFQKLGAWMPEEKKGLIILGSIAGLAVIILVQYAVTILGMCVAQIAINTEGIPAAKFSGAFQAAVNNAQPASPNAKETKNYAMQAHNNVESEPEELKF